MEGVGTRYRFVGRARRMERRWSSAESTESRRWLAGNVVLTRPVFASFDGKNFTLHLASLVVQPASRMTAYFNVRPNDRETLPSLEMWVDLPPDQFEGLCRELTDSSVLEIHGEVLGVGLLKPVGVDRTAVCIDVSEPGILVRTGEAWAPLWEADSTASHLTSLLGEVCLNERSQVGRVAVEIGQSLAALQGPMQEARLEGAKQLFEGLRAPFREYLQLAEHENAWYRTPKGFEEALQHFDDQKKRDLRAQFDTLWQHYSVVYIVQRGERAAGAIKDGYQPKVAELEHLAASLLAMPELRSATLEWALIDALIYAECLAFAQTTLAGQQFLGLTIPGELKGTQAPHAFWKRFGAWSAKRIWSGTIELIKLAATFVVASVLAQDDMQTAWMITVVVSAARWIRRALKSQKPPLERVADLLGKMATVHDCLKTPSFNARSVRQQLDEVTKEGAVFSPWVYHLLDAQIRRS